MGGFKKGWAAGQSKSTTPHVQMDRGLWRRGSTAAGEIYASTATNRDRGDQRESVEGRAQLRSEPRRERAEAAGEAEISQTYLVHSRLCCFHIYSHLWRTHLRLSNQHTSLIWCLRCILIPSLWWKCFLYFSYIVAVTKFSILLAVRWHSPLKLA